MKAVDLRYFGDGEINYCRQLAYEDANGVIYMPDSIIFGIKNDVAEVVANLVLYYFPGVKRIYDPTCGEDNYQFGKYLEYDAERGRWVYLGKYEYIASDIKKTKWNCVGDKCLVVDVLKPPYPFANNEFGLAVYDPPFLPRARQDRRASSYDIQYQRQISDIKKYYSENVLREFHRIVWKGLIVKCSDFYPDPYVEDLLLCLGDIIDLKTIRKYFKIVAVHRYRYFSNIHQLKRHRLSKSCMARHIRRMYNVDSIYIVLYKK